MTYTIKAPNQKYNRTLNGVRFSDGVATTQDEWMAQWFSGRAGFTVEREQTEEPAEEPVQQTEEPAGTSEEPEKKPRVRSYARVKK